MTTTDHKGYHKIQCWILQEIWDKIASLNFPNQTSAVTEAFNALLEKSQNIPNESQDIPRLEATIEELQLLLQEKDERISDLKRETETLNSFAHYFKSLEYRRLEQSTEEVMPNVKEPVTKPASSPGEARAVSHKKKELKKKSCKFCGKEFETTNPKKETCSDKCRAAFFRRRK
jgi:hypothetical protein